MLKIFNNELDASEFEIREYECLLTEWMQIREQYPQARLYKDVICVQNDITPKTREQAWALKSAKGNYHLLCHAGEPTTLAIVAAVLSVATAVYTYMSMQNVNTIDKVEGSPNNSLADRQNKHRVKERVADVYGRMKSILDLISPTYRHYVDGVQVEECVLTIGTGWFDIDAKDIKEGDTPISTIEGAAISFYEPGQSLISPNPQLQIGSAFDTLPIVTRQVSGIDSKQLLRKPIDDAVYAEDVTVTHDGVINMKVSFADNDDIFDWDGQSISERFNSGDKVNIRGLVFGSDPDSLLSGNTNVSIDGVLTVATKQDIQNPDKYKTINISTLMVKDVDGSSLSLSGLYSIDSIVKSGSDGAYIYEVHLSANYKEINLNFTLMTADAVGVTSATLTNSNNNIDLSGIYTIANAVENQVTLLNPEVDNPNWELVDSLSQEQINNARSNLVIFEGIGGQPTAWKYGGNKDTTGLMINFLAPNGLFQGGVSQKVELKIEYQSVANGQPTGEVVAITKTMQGKANNRSPIGLTVKQELPSAGEFRFRVQRTNDNRDRKGRDHEVIDDVVIESAYGFYTTTKSVYEHDTVARLKRVAIGSGTNASELNAIVHRKLDTPHGFKATSNFADIAKAMALDPYIGRMNPSEVDTESLYEVSAEIIEHFGTAKAAEFNYTFDNKFASYQEMIFTVAEAVFCTARRENGEHYFTFEKPTPNSLVLFNHRNIKPESMSVTEMFGIQDNYDGVEFKWRDANNNYAESVIKLPDELRTNYKTIESNGVTNKLQAHFLANRIWNKLKYNRKGIEFTAYGEADLVTRMDRAAIVDSTVPILCSGEIELQENTILTLDYPAELDPDKDYVVHLQLKNGSVEVIDIVRQLNEWQIEIAHIPMMPLVTDGVAHAMYNITEASDIEEDAYLITEKKSHGVFESTINAMSYDTRYYTQDYDYKNGLISS